MPPGQPRRPILRYTCVLVGEPSSRKTNLLSTYKLGHFPAESAPTVLKENVVPVMDCNLDDGEISLSLWDTTGQEDYYSLRLTAYLNANVVLMRFTLGNSPDLYQLRDEWVLDDQEQCLRVPYILTGIKPDSSYNSTSQEIKGSKKLAIVTGAIGYIQCNPENGSGIDNLFEMI
ncbi:P-loop containing nucleoside triphosphate hydrolase protein [Zopfia rhizophila CBS 207.26]|uniref:P-loop containing nucleoside triphosphate hydrolase protein n=1 Tax=Zopfia rhizophila CBS 207.26 TaxID=1314779 RepID=A0A6A6EUU9_9PEZI|nr:P-loop containing nucleoside triphosphate hydrolase protein [Zopfia rhizophila CBS 207.26]